MRLNIAIVAFAALGVALTSTAASAMPNGIPKANQIVGQTSNIQQMRWVSDRRGRSVWRGGPRRFAAWGPRRVWRPGPRRFAVAAWGPRRVWRPGWRATYAWGAPPVWGPRAGWGWNSGWW